MSKVINGYCPLCGEFITTRFDDAIIVKHKRFVTLYHQKCYEFNFISEREVKQDGHKQGKKEQ